MWDDFKEEGLADDETWAKLQQLGGLLWFWSLRCGLHMAASILRW
jgi:hypothetical protein